MARVLVIVATVLSLLFGTGSFNVACLCRGAAPGMGGAGGTGYGGCGEPALISFAEAEAANAGHEQEDDGSCCCSAPCEPKPESQPTELPGKCPCLYWTGVPLGTAEPAPTPVLLKPAMALPPVLLMEVAGAASVCGGGERIRAGPLILRAHGARPQAWLCMWTI